MHRYCSRRQPLWKLQQQGEYFPRFVIEKEMGDSVANIFFLFSALESSQPVAWEVAQISPTIRITAEAVSLFLVKESARHAVLGPVLT